MKKTIVEIITKIFNPQMNNFISINNQKIFVDRVKTGGLKDIVEHKRPCFYYISEELIQFRDCIYFKHKDKEISKEELIKLFKQFFEIYFKVYLDYDNEEESKKMFLEKSKKMLKELDKLYNTTIFSKKIKNASLLNKYKSKTQPPFFSEEIEKKIIEEIPTDSKISGLIYVDINEKNKFVKFIIKSTDNENQFEEKTNTEGIYFFCLEKGNYSFIIIDSNWKDKLIDVKRTFSVSNSNNEFKFHFKIKPLFTRLLEKIKH